MSGWVNGQNKSKIGPLLKTVHNKPRDVWDGGTYTNSDEIEGSDHDDMLRTTYGSVESPDPLPTSSGLRGGGTRRRQPTGQHRFEAPKRRRVTESDSQEDELAEPDAPTVTGSIRDERARSLSAQPDVGRENEQPAHFDHSRFMGGLFSHTPEDEVMKRASAPLKPWKQNKEAGRNWDDGSKRNRRKPPTYGKKQAGFPSKEKAITAVPTKKEKTTMLSESDEGSDRNGRNARQHTPSGRRRRAFKPPTPLPETPAHLKKNTKKVDGLSSDSDPREGSPSFKSRFGGTSKANIKGRDEETSDSQNQARRKGRFVNPSKHDLPEKPKEPRNKMFLDPSKHDLPKSRNANANVLRDVITSSETSDGAAPGRNKKFVNPSDRHPVALSRSSSSNLSGLSDQDSSKDTDTRIRTTVARKLRSEKLPALRSHSPICEGVAEEDYWEGSQQVPTSSQREAIDDISKFIYETGINDSRPLPRNTGKDICEICNDLLPKGFRAKWRKKGGGRMEMCIAHKKLASETAWRKRGYPIIDFKKLRERTAKHVALVNNIIDKKVDSPCYRMFENQQKQTGGRVSKLLTDLGEKLQYPGYYGPRGSSIMLQCLIKQVGSKVGDASLKDPVMARAGVSGFIQSVLVPEVGVRLIMEDMDVDEARARKILVESQEAGEQLHLEDEGEDDIYDEDDDSGWVDINATQNHKLMRAQKREAGTDYGYESSDSGEE